MSTFQASFAANDARDAHFLDYICTGRAYLYFSSIQHPVYMVENTPSKKLPDPNDPDYSRQDALRDESLSKQAPRSSSSKSPGLNERQLRYIHDYLEDAIEVGRSASRRLPKFIRNDDIEGAALRGLYYAAKDFDPSRGIPFDRYLSIRVRGEILDETRRRDPLPRPTRIRLTLLNKTIQKLTQALERSPTPDEIYQRTNMTPTEQAQLLQAGGAAKQQVNASEGDEAWDTLPSIPDPSPQGDVLSSQMDLIDKAIRKLAKADEKTVKIFGLYYWQRLPFSEIAKITGLTESAVCKIHRHTIEDLRLYLREDADLGE